ncbi:hypothetical protein FA13DRAFT_1800552 [Coprinellus micaceus]|uniref:Uncharacterized protein n=1 Tax=Coprinellus micaceus TaxID=71717 RepID=A0A4Y7SG56_COPMI|nr:hypothetical protein FA13DRAFT_1800552 [Coprinellus micaceus]
MDALVEAAELQLAAEMIVALCNNQRLGPQSPQKGYNAVTGSSDSIKVEEDDPTLPNLEIRAESVTEGWKCIVPTCTRVFATESLMEAHSLNCTTCPGCGHYERRRQTLVYQHLLQRGNETCRLLERDRLVKHQGIYGLLLAYLVVPAQVNR